MEPAPITDSGDALARLRAVKGCAHYGGDRLHIAAAPRAWQCQACASLLVAAIALQAVEEVAKDIDSDGHKDKAMWAAHVRDFATERWGAP